MNFEAEIIRDKYLDDTFKNRKMLMKGLKKVRKLDDNEPFKRETELLFKAAINKDQVAYQNLFDEYVTKLEMLLAIRAGLTIRR
ncbi:hypothetical protein [Oceanobacillus kimchii]|uniref:hypothetical protein n=1 Tax=Oceanobacillus kimchii TaxID=746691 RepID=UPI00232C6FC2|nr:hypothetical protein [Oceanobacillus kimchii]